MVAHSFCTWLVCPIAFGPVVRQKIMARKIYGRAKLLTTWHWKTKRGGRRSWGPNFPLNSLSSSNEVPCPKGSKNSQQHQG
jgi:hypothetical protein